MAKRSEVDAIMRSRVMPRVCIVEPQAHPAPGVLGRRLPEFGDFGVRTVDVVPDPLNEVDALVLNSMLSTPDSVPADRVLRFVEDGGGLFAVHDSVYPYAADRQFIAACGIRAAFDVVQPIQTPEGITYQVLLARANPDDPIQYFPVRPIPEGAGHPILQEVCEFEVSEEVWAQNLALGVRPLFSVDVGDRIPSHQRFHQAIPVCGCKVLGKGRLAFFSLGHFPAMYEHPKFLRFSGEPFPPPTRSRLLHPGVGNSEWKALFTIVLTRYAGIGLPRPSFHTRA